MKAFITIVVVIGLLISLPAFAQEKELKAKSMTVATILALDPIPGDALIYAGQVKQGIFNSLLGTGGIVALSLVFSGYFDENKTYSEGLDGMGEAIQKSFMVGLGGALYLSSYFWDLIGGIRYAKKHNLKVQVQKQAAWKSIRPVATITDGGFMGGIRMEF